MFSQEDLADRVPPEFVSSGCSSPRQYPCSFGLSYNASTIVVVACVFLKRGLRSIQVWRLAPPSIFSCMTLVSDCSLASITRAALATERDHSFGFEIILNFGAAGEAPIRHSSTSNPKKRKLSLVILFSQSSVERCSSVNRAAIHIMVTASRPDA